MNCTRTNFSKKAFTIHILILNHTIQHIMSKYVHCVPLKLWHSIKVQNLEKIDPKFKAKNWGCPNVWIIQSIVAHICRVYPPQQGHSELIQNSTMWACQLKHSSASSISYSVLWWDFKYIQSVLEVGEECWGLFANSTLLSFLWQHITLSDVCLANESKKPTSMKNLSNIFFCNNPNGEHLL